nr:GNAT family N-acetyltransferase [Ornithinimicrobium sp. F0845]
MHRWRPTGHWGGLAVVRPGAPDDAESTALAALLETAPDFPLEWFSTAEGRDLRLPAGFEPTGAGRWDFLSTRTAPSPLPLPEGLDLVTLDDATDAERLQAFGTTHNDGFEGFPGHGFSLRWRTVVDAQGDLLAIGALHELDTGLPHLSGLVVHQDQRGRGLGRLLTVDLTRAALRQHGVCTLGVFSDNLAAIGLYRSLGYTTHHHFHTRDFVPVRRSPEERSGRGTS